MLDGSAGSGDAPWLADLDPPAPAAGQDPPAIRSTYDLDSIPVDPLRPLATYVKAEAARRLLTNDLGLTDADALAPYVSSDPPRIHPYFVAGRMAPLTRHNFTYGPTIHVRSQIQHRGPAFADREVTVGARIVDAYDRNGHCYQVLDGVVTSATGAQPAENLQRVAHIRHHTIFRPRGTTMPEAIRSADLE